MDSCAKRVDSYALLTLSLLHSDVTDHLVCVLGVAAKKDRADIDLGDCTECGTRMVRLANPSI